MKERHARPRGKTHFSVITWVTGSFIYSLSKELDIMGSKLTVNSIIGLCPTVDAKCARKRALGNSCVLLGFMLFRSCIPLSSSQTHIYYINLEIRREIIASWRGIEPRPTTVDAKREGETILDHGAKHIRQSRKWILLLTGLHYPRRFIINIRTSSLRPMGRLISPTPSKTS